MSNVLVTGGAGYVGSTLIRDLLADGHRVKCMDMLVYGGKAIVGFMNHPNFEFIYGDIRDNDALRVAITDVDDIVHLAGIVGDLPCQAAPVSTVQINYYATKSLATLAREMKVKRFVFASTCSNYGISDPNILADENSKLNPVSLYAETKVDCERFLKSIADDNYATTSLRFGTAYGVSFRTRFDLLVNSFAFEAWSKNEIVVFAANTWRPYVHVADMSLLTRMVLDAPKEKMAGQIFNAGSTQQNYIKKDVVEIIKGIMPGLKTKYIDTVDDRRDYRVDCSCLENLLGFKASRTVEDGFRELISCFQNGILNEIDFETNKIETLEKFFGDKESYLKRE
jgi:nucleoside-diphosphate-sugar epimerase